MTDEYQRQVGDIIAAQSRDSTWEPTEKLELFVKNRRQPRTLAELAPIEREQLKRIWRGDDIEARLTAGVHRDEELEEDFEDDLEVAEVVDDEGVIRYRLWGMNYGVIYLLAGEGLDCIAFAAQHDLEHWRAEQRPIFWAMDRALRRGGHGFSQGSKFCWWVEKCWNEIAGKDPDTLQSHGYMRALFDAEN